MLETTLAGVPVWAWLLFHGIIIAMLALDLGVFNRKAHVVQFREALFWSIVWISCALLFNVGIGFTMGGTAGGQFLAAYLVEKALSVDNIFVFLVLFRYFRVPQELYHKVLFWGVIGAVFMRAFFITAGLAIIDRFHWVLYIMGVFLLWTAVKLVREGEEREVDPGKNPIVRICRKIMPVTDEYAGNRFFTRIGGVLFATPLFIAVIAVETTDVVFAMDSIPAVLAITSDPFLAYTSNIFAILGLRALFFLVSGLLDSFQYLRYGLSAILFWVGTKMLIADFWKPPIWLSLGVIVLCLVGSMVASRLLPVRAAPPKEDGPAAEE